MKNNINIKNHCLIGDFRYYITVTSQEFLNNLLEYEYIPCFLGITRPSQKKVGGTCMDNMYIKSKSLAINAFKLANLFNGHYPLILTFDKMNTQSERKINNTVLSYKKLKCIANKVYCNSFLHEQNQNTATDKLLSLIKECANKATIIKINNKCKEKTKRKNWITKAIMISCRTKEFLYKLQKKKPSCEALKLQYKNYCSLNMKKM